MTLHSVLALFLWMLGLCIGSFLNVVIYRLPRGLAVHTPKRSFCPNCRTTLRAADNIPVLSWLLLRGKCRYCGMCISIQYPIVEAITGLVFVLTFHLLFVEHARVGIADASVTRDAPLLIAWLVLAAALVACSGMDFASYMVDTRVTDAALLTGVLLHAFWPNEGYVRSATSSHAIHAAALAAFLAAGAMLLWSTRRAQHDAEGAEADADHPDEATPRTSRTKYPAALLGIAVLIGLSGVGAVIVEPGLVAEIVIATSFVVLFLTLVLAAGHPRDADQELHEAIEQESSSARRVALLELLWLAPTLIAAAAAYVIVEFIPAAGSVWSGILDWSPGGGFVPFAGACLSITGAMVGAAAGWVIRIPFTILFGREAFGVGDIFILAAAGAVAGWDLALLGFLLSVGIGLFAWICGAFLKRNTMIAFGPPLALGFLAALWLNRPAARIAGGYIEQVRVLWESRPGMLIVGVGLLLVAIAPAVLLSRLLRRSLESAFPEKDD